MTARIPKIHTQRLSLRRLRPEDTDALHRILKGRGMLRYFPNPQPPTRERVSSLIARQIDHWREYGYGWWAVDARPTGTLIGWCGLQFLPETGEVEVAYLLDRDYWGRGLATEAATAALQFGFDEVELDTIIALAHPGNTSSQRVIDKLGMAFTEDTVYFDMMVRRYSLTRPRTVEVRGVGQAPLLGGEEDA